MIEFIVTAVLVFGDGHQEARFFESMHPRGAQVCYVMADKSGDYLAKYAAQEGAAGGWMICENKEAEFQDGIQ